MTIDKQKLKALAEALVRDEQGQELTKEEVKSFPMMVFEFEAMLAPSAVLALLAEIDRLEDSLHGASAEVHGLSLQSNRACRARDEARAERDQLKAENEALRTLVLSALEEGKGRPGTGGNAPGHCHAIPGVWDRGNGDRSGTTCGWCRIWNAAQAMAKESSHG